MDESQSTVAAMYNHLKALEGNFRIICQKKSNDYFLNIEADSYQIKQSTRRN